MLKNMHILCEWSLVDHGIQSVTCEHFMQRASSLWRNVPNGYIEFPIMFLSC